MKIQIFLFSLIACIATFCHSKGVYFIFQDYAIFLLAVGTVPVHSVAIWNKEIEWEFFRHPLAQGHRRFWAVIANQWAFSALTVKIVSISTAILQFTEKEYHREILLANLCSVIVAIAAVIPYRKTNYLLNVLILSGNFIMLLGVYRIAMPPHLEGSVILTPPASKQFYILNGGNSALVNSYNSDRHVRHILFILISEKRFRDPKVDPEKDYYGHTFGETVYAPVGGIVRKIVNHIPDLPLGVMDDSNPPGNRIVIEMDEDHFLYLANLKKDSILVEEGQVVEIGQVLAKCGKSGRVSEPVLGILISNKSSVGDIASADAVSYPIRFKNVRLVGSENLSTKESYYPQRNDFFVPLLGDH